MRPWHAARLRRGYGWLALAAGIAATATTGWLVWSYLGEPPAPAPWLVPTPDNLAVPLLLIGSTSLALWGVWFRKRGQTFLPEYGIIASAVIAIMLGLASYLPCASGQSLAAVLVGVLNLFTGQVETTMIGPDASSACQGPYPLIFQIARAAGLATLVFSALAVLAVMARPPIDRLRGWFAQVIDVVVGLNPTSFPLVKALCEERDARQRRPTWYRRRLRPADWAPWAHPRSTVVVVHSNDTDPLVDEARALGALVYVGTPTDPDLLRRVVISKRWLVAAHRLYAVTDSQRDNVTVVTEVQQIIRGRRPSTDTSWLSRGTVPRLVARFSDAREARDWRLRNVSAVGCLVDAVTTDGLLARTLVDRVAEYGATDLLISGDTPLTVAILDQVAQQRAFRSELQTKRSLPPAQDETDGSPPWEDVLNEVTQLHFDEVTILAETSAELCAEWQASRAPCAEIPTLLEPLAQSADWEPAVASAISRGRRPVLIITDTTSPLVSARATRLTVTHPDLLVLRPSANVQGVEPLSGADRSATPGEVVVRFGPSLVHDERPPDDTWTVLAQQQHEMFCGRRRVRPAELPPSRLLWERDASGLPEFFREDNLRQHRHLLMLIQEQGYQWRAARLDARAPELPRAVLATVAEREHERWCAFRRQNGWRKAPEVAATPEALPPARKRSMAMAAKKALDENRLSTNLVEWGTYDPVQETGLQKYNIDALCEIVERLRRWGVEPWPTGASASGT